MTSPTLIGRKSFVCHDGIFFHFVFPVLKGWADFSFPLSCEYYLCCSLCAKRSFADVLVLIGKIPNNIVLGFIYCKFYIQYFPDFCMYFFPEFTSLFTGPPHIIKCTVCLLISSIFLCIFVHLFNIFGIMYLWKIFYQFSWST